MEKKEIEEVARKITGYYETEVELKRDLEDIRHDFLDAWLSADAEEILCADRKKFKNELFVLDLMIEALTPKDESEAVGK